MTEFQKQAVMIALTRMFETQKHFSICDLDSILSVTGSYVKTKDYEALRCLHCVNYADMTQELRDMLFEKVVEIVRSNGFDTELLGRIVFNDKQKQIARIKYQIGIAS